MNKLIFPEHVFKKWIFIHFLLRDQVKLQRLLPLEEIFNTYMESILTPGKTEDEMYYDALKILNKLNKKPTDWIWDVQTEIHNLSDAERFTCLFKKMKELLELTKIYRRHSNFYETYSRYLTEDYIQFLQDSELYD